MATHLTDTAIAKAAREVIATGKQRDLYDAGCRGLLIRLTPGGAKTFNLSCRDLEGKARRFPLGAYLPDGKGMGISAARDAARALHVQIKSGGADPAKEKAKLRAIGKDAKEGIGTLAALLNLYAEKGKPGAKLKSWKAQRQAIENVFAKHLDRPLATMTAFELKLTAHSHKAEYAAALAVRCLRPVLKWAAGLDFAPVQLAEIHPPATVQRRKRVLSRDELAALLPVLRASDRPYGAAMRFMLLTLGRREEVGSALWRHVDMTAQTWTIPETKNGKPHIVPLPRQAIELLRSRLPTDKAGNTVKPDPAALIFATSAGKPLGNWDREAKRLIVQSGLAEVVETATRAGRDRHNVGDVVMKDRSELPTRHDLRRTGATMLGQDGIIPDIIEAALNHATIHSPLAGTYNQSRYRPQVADALQRLADALDLIEGGGAQVIQLRA